MAGDAIAARRAAPTPAAFVERGLAHGLLAPQWALDLAERASPEATIWQNAGSPRVEYYAAVLDGASLTAAQRARLEEVALDVALHGRRVVNGPPSLDFASLALLLPRLTGKRRAAAGERALAYALPAAPIRDQLLRAIAPALTERELEQALAAVLDPEDDRASLPATWHDDPESDTEAWDFAEVMTLIPHLRGRSRRRAVVVALRRASRIGHNSEFRGRDLWPRAAALADLAPYLTDEDTRAWARRVAEGSGLPVPPQLTWPVERARLEEPLALARAFLAGEPCRRWSRHDDWTLTRVLSGLPVSQRDELVAEALDCLWHHDFGHDEPAFLSRGVRAAARCLERARVAECLGWHGIEVMP